MEKNCNSSKKEHKNIVFTFKNIIVLKVWCEVDKTYLRCFAHLNRFVHALESAYAIAHISRQGLYHLLVVTAFWATIVGRPDGVT